MRDRKDFILRCLAAYNRFSPPPEDVNKADVLSHLQKSSLARLNNVATYIDEQLKKHGE